MADIRCRTCRKPVGEVFGFCASCGEPLCPMCLWKYPREHEEVKTMGVPGVAHRATTLTKELPRCVSCLNTYIRAQKEARKHFWRDTIVGTIVYYLPFLVFILYVAFIAKIVQFDSALAAVSCLVTLFFPGLLIGLAVASLLKRHYLKRALKDHPLVYETTIFCPNCGNYSKKDLFKTAKMMIKSQEKSFWDSLFGPSTRRLPDAYQCNTCGYYGPLSPLMGIRLYLQRYGRTGKEKLKGTVWKSLLEKGT